MKTNFTIALLLAGISTTAFSQPPPGGGTECPASYSIKKNNGNGTVCNADAEIRVIFLQMPSPNEIPSITAIEYLGQPLRNIKLPVKGTLVNNGQGYISFCFEATDPKNNGDPFAKIPPATKLVLELTTVTGVVCRTDNVN